MRLSNRNEKPSEPQRDDVLRNAYRHAWKYQNRRAVNAELALWAVLDFFEVQCRLSKLKSPLDVVTTRDEAREIVRLVETILGVEEPPRRVEIETRMVRQTPWTVDVLERLMNEANAFDPESEDWPEGWLFALHGPDGQRIAVAPPTEPPWEHVDRVGT